MSTVIVYCLPLGLGLNTSVSHTDRTLASTIWQVATSPPLHWYFTSVAPAATPLCCCRCCQPLCRRRRRRPCRSRCCAACSAAPSWRASPAAPAARSARTTALFRLARCAADFRSAGPARDPATSSGIHSADTQPLPPTHGQRQPVRAPGDAPCQQPWRGLCAGGLAAQPDMRAARHLLGQPQVFHGLEGPGAGVGGVHHPGSRVHHEAAPQAVQVPQLQRLVGEVPAPQQRTGRLREEQFGPGSLVRQLAGCAGAAGCRQVRRMRRPAGRPEALVTPRNTSGVWPAQARQRQ